MADELFPKKTADDYIELITNEHQGKPKYEAMLSAVMQPVADDYNFNMALNHAFDVDSAIGVQLDQIGLWVGFPRHIKTPLFVYFSFDRPELGFDLGLWQGRFDPDQGLTELDDETYRFFIKAKIGANHWHGSMPEYDAIINLALEGTDTEAFAIDNQNMSMDVFFFGMPVSALMKGVLQNGYLAMKSEAVRIAYHEPSEPKTPFFGFDLDSRVVKGFDAGSFSVTF